MVASPSPNDPSAHLANLLQAGQQSMKQFEDALAAAMGVPAKRSMPMGQVFSPVAFIADMHHEYLTQFWRAWNSVLVKTFTLGARSAIQPARGDRRFKEMHGRRRHTTICSRNHIFSPQSNYRKWSIARKSTTERGCSFDFLRVSTLTH